MRYFLLEHDEKFQDVPLLKSWHAQLDVRKIKRGQSHALPHRVLLEIYPNPSTVFSDVIVKPFLLLSDMARKTVSIYESRIPYKQVVLLDYDNGLTSLYFLPILETVYCLSTKSEISREKTVIYHPVFEESKLPTQSIFELGGLDNSFIVIRLDLAESLLRRGMRGIVLREVEIVGSDSAPVKEGCDN